MRVEEKMIHGHLVQVKIYAPATSPHELMEVDSSEGETITSIHQLFGNKLSEVWITGKGFDSNNI